MSIDQIVIVAALLLFAVLVGVAVRCVLVGRARMRAVCAGDDALERLLHQQGSLAGRLLAAKRQRQLREGLPDALDMIANSLTAGLTLPQAMLRNLEHFPPVVDEEFARILYDTRLGFSLGGAFDNFAKRNETEDTRMIAIASKIGVAHGGRLHENYRMLSGILRDNMAFERELRAMTTEGRMQAIVMSCLPFALMAILGAIRPEMMKPLFTTTAGWGTLAGLCLMISLAFVWIRKIVSIKV